MQSIKEQLKREVHTEVLTPTYKRHGKFKNISERKMRLNEKRFFA